MKLWQRLLVPFSGLVALCGCAPVDILNFTIPRSGYTLHSDIAYGEDPRQKLDIYVPDTPSPDHQVIVFFYGGSWQSGSKKDYRFVGQALASKGFIAVLADYRLYPQVYFPDFMEDAAGAFMWTHNHIGEYGGNTKNIFVSGHSSGAYNAIMLTLNEKYLKAAGGNTSFIKGAIGIAGPYDFLPFTDKNIIALFSHAPDAETQPVNYVKAGLQPLLLLTGDIDTQVLPRNTHHLLAKLRAAGDEVEVKIYPDVGHVGIILAMARGFHYKAPTLSDISDFVIKHTAH